MPAPDDAAAYQHAAKETRALETQRRHAIEVVAKTLAAVQDLEVRLEVGVRWVPGNDKAHRGADFRAGEVNMAGTIKREALD
ncbi:hypothetical protein B0H10DRAFT_2243583 [Mycena sp. CBHHK59/15]|nr:hypothetical protein B0H10DRAFT_2243583 [Mycena sp. CBHHK59/15]